MYVLLDESEGLRVTSVAAFRRENIRPVSFEVNDNISDTLVIIIDHNQIRFVETTSRMSKMIYFVLHTRNDCTWLFDKFYL